MEFYSQAAELFSAEDSTAEASKCRQKVRDHVMESFFTQFYFGCIVFRYRD